MIIQIAASAASLFMFEVFLTIWLSFFFNTQFTYVVLGIAMMGICLGGVYLALRPQARFPQARFTLALGFSMICVLALGHWISVLFNAGVGRALAEGGKEAAIAAIPKTSAMWTPIIGIAAAVPFFIFSILIGRAFQKVKPEQVSRIYALELVCGAIGCAGAAFAVELGGYATCVIAMIALCLLPMIWDRSCRDMPGLVGAAILSVATAAGLIFNVFEPVPQLDTITRNYELKFKVTELWHDWTTYSRVTYLEVEKPMWTDRLMVIGNGYGHAYASKIAPGEFGRSSDYIAPLVTAIKKPQSSLVLFAGMGRDLIDLYNYNNGIGEFTGVELNPKLVKYSIDDPSTHLGDFVRLPNVHYEVTEARAFLERSQEKFDLILLSWSGSTIAYFTGAVGHTAQFMYTKEAFVSVVEHLNPDGMFAVMNSNKVNLLSTLRTVFEERQWPKLENSVVIANDPLRNNTWTHLADDNFALVKPSGFTSVDLEKIREVAAQQKLEIVYDPQAAPLPEWPYSRVLRSPNLTETLLDLGAKTERRFSVSDDNWPYSLWLDPLTEWLSVDSWSHMYRRLIAGDLRKWYPDMYVVVIIAFCLLVTFGPLAFSGIPLWGSQALPTSLNFLLIGLGFMFVESGLVHALALALETAGWTTAIGIAGLVLSTGLGSLLSERWRGAQLWTLFALLVLILIFSLYHGPVIRWMLQWPLSVRALLTLIFIFPLGILMGQQFAPALSSLARTQPRLIAWAWAFNGVGGTIAGVCAPTMAESHGFSYVMFAGLACYVALFISMAVTRVFQRAEVAAPFQTDS